MTTTPDAGGPDANSPEELREQAEKTRDQLGETAAGPSGAAEVRQQVGQKAAEVGTQVQEQTARTAQRVQEKAAQLSHSVRERTPEQVRTTAGQVADTARRNPRPLLVASAVGLMALLLLRKRRNGSR